MTNANIWKAKSGPRLVCVTRRAAGHIDLTNAMYRDQVLSWSSTIDHRFACIGDLGQLLTIEDNGWHLEGQISFKMQVLWKKAVSPTWSRYSRAQNVMNKIAICWAVPAIKNLSIGIRVHYHPCLPKLHQACQNTATSPKLTNFIHVHPVVTADQFHPCSPPSTSVTKNNEAYANSPSWTNYLFRHMHHVHKIWSKNDGNKFSISFHVMRIG